MLPSPSPLLEPSIGLSNADFVRVQLFGNSPALISARKVPWPVDARWVRADGELDVDAITRDFGDCLVPVHRCPRHDVGIEENIERKEPEEMRVRDFFARHWHPSASSSTPRRDATSERAAFQQFIAEYHNRHAKNYNLHELLSGIRSRFLRMDGDAWYLKDWHMTRDQRSSEMECSRQDKRSPLYSVHQFFADDWLNAYWDREHPGEDDYRFVYIGTSGSWTRFHADVLR